MAEYRVGFRVKERAELGRTGIIMKVSPKGKELFVLWRPCSEDALQPWAGVKYAVSDFPHVADVVESQEAPHGFQIGQRLLLYTRTVLTVTGIRKMPNYYEISVDGPPTFSDRSFGDKTLLSILAVNRHKKG